MEQDFVGANDSQHSQRCVSPNCIVTSTLKMRCGFFLSMDTAGLSPITSQSPFIRLSLSDQQDTHSLSQILQELPSYPSVVSTKTTNLACY